MAAVLIVGASRRYHHLVHDHQIAGCMVAQCGVHAMTGRRYRVSHDQSAEWAHGYRPCLACVAAIRREQAREVSA